MPEYIDYNASTPIDDRIISFMTHIYKTCYGNYSSNHQAGKQIYSLVADARKQVANLFDLQPMDITFTSGATESNNLAILGLALYGKIHNKKHIIASAIEHKSVLEPLTHLMKNGFEIDLIYPDSSGRINHNELLNKIRSDTLLVSIMHVNNETGIIQPLEAICTDLSSSNTLLHIDATQSSGKLVNEIKKLSYDYLSISSHKMYGPQGVGALLHPKGLQLEPLLFGGQQEFGLRPGTLPTALIVGFGKACELAEHEYEDNNIICKNNKKLILDILSTAGCKYEINGEPSFCMPNTLNISVYNIIASNLVQTASNIACFATGSACNCNNGYGSHVLKAMGLSEERIRSAIRLSWGNRPLDKAQLQQFAELIKQMQTAI